MPKDKKHKRLFRLYWELDGLIRELMEHPRCPGRTQTYLAGTLAVMHESDLFEHFAQEKGMKKMHAELQKAFKPLIDNPALPHSLQCEMLDFLETEWIDEDELEPEEA